MPRIRASLFSAAMTVALVACADPAPTQPPPPSGAASPAASTAISATSTPDPATPDAASAEPSSAPSADSPSASAPPTDAAAAFVSVVTDPSFSASIAITGSTRIGKATSSTRGSLDVFAGSRHLAVVSRAPRSTSTRETVTANAVRYIRELGVWVQAGPAVDDDLVAVLGHLATVTVAGSEVVDGQTLARLVIAPPGFVPAELALPSGISGLETTWDAWVEADGTPVTMSFAATWTQAAGSRHVEGTKRVDFAFSNVGGAVAVTVPTDLWRFRTSRRFAYRMAYPDDWTFKAGSRKFADSYYGFDGTAVFASRAKSSGLTLGRLSSALARYLPRIAGVKRFKIDHNRPARLGPLKARRIEFHYRYKGKRYWSVGYLAVYHGSYYWVALESTSKTTADDIALAARFAHTFSPR